MPEPDGRGDTEGVVFRRRIVEGVQVDASPFFDECQGVLEKAGTVVDMSWDDLLRGDALRPHQAVHHVEIRAVGADV